MLSTLLSKEGLLPAISGIYGLRSKTTGKWYIGQSLDIKARWNKYKNLNCKNQGKLLRALSKYGYDDFEKVILESNLTEQLELDEKEAHWIQYYDAIANGYNIRAGGSHGKFSEETRKKMSEATRPRHSAETRAKISVGNKGKTMSPEAIAKTAAAIRGRKHTSETKAKMSAARLGKKRGPHSEEHKRRISESCKASQWGWERGRRKKE